MEGQDLKRLVSELGVEKALIDTLTEQHRAKRKAVDEAFLEATAATDKATVQSDVFGAAVYMSKLPGKPSERKTRFEMRDEQAAVDWFEESKAEADGFALAYMAKFCEWWFETTGEVPGGCSATEYDTVAKPPTTRLNAKGEEVFKTLKERFGFELDAALPNLLEGEVDGA